MSGCNFIKGAAVGMVIGSAVGMMMPSHRKMCGRRSSIGKAIKAVGEVVENFTDFMGF